jgi:hypothetical protein
MVTSVEVHFGFREFDGDACAGALPQRNSDEKQDLPAARGSSLHGGLP